MSLSLKEKPDPVAVARHADFMRSASANGKTQTKKRVDDSLDIINNL